jgi:uncharacterized protein
MKHLLIAIVCVISSAVGVAQTGDQPASRDDVILLLQTMHSHDLMQKVLAAQSSGMRQLLHDQIMQDKGAVPADFETRFTKVMEDLIKGMPVDEITEAMIPSYQKHFTHNDIGAMNAFYSSPVGQKVLGELPAVMQEGMQAAVPVISKYMNEWKDRMQKEMEGDSAKSDKTPAVKN